MRHRVLNPLAALLLLSSAAQAAAPVEADRFRSEAVFGAARVLTMPPFTLQARPAPAVHAAPALCSGLDFSNVTWPASFSAEDKLALPSALNITGSFEGAAGWGNITDNFDGQGLSLGLLNQNLGQGTLQPLLLKMRDDHPGVLSAGFSAPHRASLLGMLTQWETAMGPPRPAHYSRLDQPPSGGVILASPGDGASVDWAKANLYAGAAFDPAWKAELVALALTPEYVSLQVAEAVSLHEKAVGYESRIGIRELRAYLMLFDVVVQNGGLHPIDLTEYDDYVAANPSASVTAKLEKLLELRLRHVRRRFVADVRARKRAIINGRGRVHGSDRDLPVQYCYDGAWPYK
ncbi:MAG: hypothetical protein HYZ75_08900 [Elusimicrobia bacterium]|nr:hypothetical protein [Elusimicrobiota bacterium]